MELQGRETMVLINHMILKQLHKETVGLIYGWNIFQEVSFSLVYLGELFYDSLLTSNYKTTRNENFRKMSIFGL